LRWPQVIALHFKHNGAQALAAAARWASDAQGSGDHGGAASHAMEGLRGAPAGPAVVNDEMVQTLKGLLKL
jgi:hypothetical protein